MTITELMIKMIGFSHGNLQDINHFLKVYTYAKTIGEGESLPPKEQFILECAAILHDIACPLCREKYGNTYGPYQEKEGILLTDALLKETDMAEELKQRIIFLVGHHHTVTQIDGLDYQILLEADYLVNAEEHHYTKETICTTRENIFRTKTGIHLLNTIYAL